MSRCCRNVSLSFAGTYIVNYTISFFPAVIVPTVVHERDALIDGVANQPDTLIFVCLFTNVITAEANHRDPFSGPPQATQYHVTAALFFGPDTGQFSCLFGDSSQWQN